MQNGYRQNFVFIINLLFSSSCASFLRCAVLNSVDFALQRAKLQKKKKKRKKRKEEFGKGDWSRMEKRNDITGYSPNTATRVERLTVARNNTDDAYEIYVRRVEAALHPSTLLKTVMFSAPPAVWPNCGRGEQTVQVSKVADCPISVWHESNERSRSERGFLSFSVQSSFSSQPALFLSLHVSRTLPAYIVFVLSFVSSSVCIIRISLTSVILL